MLKPHSQSSVLRIFSFILGSIFGGLLTILVLKFIEQNELLQQTTKPETYTGKFRELPSTISQHVNLNDSVKILCFVLTHPANHLTKAVAVKETWGKRCNKLVFISSQEESYLDVLQVNVTEETRLFLWQKTKLALSAIYENFLDDYDYFLKADDDTWIFMENLRQFLYAYSPEMPIYFGCKLKPFVKQGYMSGSAYVLTREALKRFYTRALPHSNICYEGSDGAEDTELGSCLQSVGVLAGDSRDDQQRSRFLPFPPDGHTKNVYGTTWLDTSTFYEIKKGYECCSSSVISFHYIVHRQMYIFEYLLYHVNLYGSQPHISELPKKLELTEVISKLLNSSPAPAPAPALIHKH